MRGVLFAVLSALLYGTGVAFEHRQAAASPASAAGRPRLVLLLLRQPLWIVGAGCELSGFAAHSAALSAGSLGCVQMILAGSLIVSVSVGSWLQKRRHTRRSVLAVLAVVVGVGGTVALLGPHGHDHGADSGHQVAIAAAITGLAAAPVVAAAFVARGRNRARLLGCAAGLSDAFVAVITMAFAHLAGHGIAAVVTSWPTYALIVGGLGSMVVTQTAFQADRPLITLPLISAITPLVSLIVGLTVLGETADLSAPAIGTVAVCVVIASVGLLTLARESARTTNHSPGPAAAHIDTAYTGPRAKGSHTLAVTSRRNARGVGASRRPSHVGPITHDRPTTPASNHPSTARSHLAGRLVAGYAGPASVTSTPDDHTLRRSVALDLAAVQRCPRRAW